MKGLVLDAGALIALDRGNGRQAGELLAASGTSDAIDATVALLARSGDLLYTSDPGDLRKLCGATGIRAVVIGC